ncbi:MAG: hypothetical protein Q7S33_00145 [Nanoarchaeota archaeon]|nr:hypothetical protein [Nanoarchaeota archaeon]
MKKDLDLVRIVSYIFFDGHLYKSLKCFYLSSKDINNLKEFEKLVKKKFNINGKYYLNDGGAGRNKTHKYRIFSKKICMQLNNLGVPKGSKTINKFSIPSWILKNKKFAKEFVRIAYLCEGSMKENRKNPRIKFNINKSKDLLKNGLKFIKDIKKILKDNNIKTTKIGIYNAKSRKDGILVKELRFRVITQDNNKFIKEIGWLK